MSAWQVGDTAYGVELPDGKWLYMAVPFTLDDIEAQAYTVVAD